MYSSSAEYWLCHLFPNRWLFTRICRKFAYVAKCAIPQAPSHLTYALPGSASNSRTGVPGSIQYSLKVLTSSFNPVVQYIHSVRSKRSKVFFFYKLVLDQKAVCTRRRSIQCWRGQWIALRGERGILSSLDHTQLAQHCHRIHQAPQFLNRIHQAPQFLNAKLLLLLLFPT